MIRVVASRRRSSNASSSVFIKFRVVTAAANRVWGWACISRAEAIHVLLVDDDPRLREFISEALVGEGYRVTTAENGAVALEKMRHELPEIVVTDLTMPKMDGAEALRQIRQNWGLLPVIILTGFTDNNHMRRAMEFSPFTLLAKPCPITQLSQTIRSLLPQKTYLRAWKQACEDHPSHRAEQKNQSPQTPMRNGDRGQL